MEFIKRVFDFLAKLAKNIVFLWDKYPDFWEWAPDWLLFSLSILWLIVLIIGVTVIGLFLFLWLKAATPELISLFSSWFGWLKNLRIPKPKTRTSRVKSNISDWLGRRAGEMYWIFWKTNNRRLALCWSCTFIFFFVALGYTILHPLLTPQRQVEFLIKRSPASEARYSSFREWVGKSQESQVSPVSVATISSLKTYPWRGKLWLIWIGLFLFSIPYTFIALREEFAWAYRAVRKKRTSEGKLEKGPSLVEQLLDQAISPSPGPATTPSAPAHKLGIGTTLRILSLDFVWALLARRQSRR